jgi:hypothetical protein
MLYSNSQDALKIFIDSLSIGEKLASATSEALSAYIKMRSQPQIDAVKRYIEG